MTTQEPITPKPKEDWSEYWAKAPRPSWDYQQPATEFPWTPLKPQGEKLLLDLDAALGKAEQDILAGREVKLADIQAKRTAWKDWEARFDAIQDEYYQGGREQLLNDLEAAPAFMGVLARTTLASLLRSSADFMEGAMDIATPGEAPGGHKVSPLEGPKPSIMEEDLVPQVRQRPPEKQYPLEEPEPTPSEQGRERLLREVPAQPGSLEYGLVKPTVEAIRGGRTTEEALDKAGIKNQAARTVVGVAAEAADVIGALLGPLKVTKPVRHLTNPLFTWGGKTVQEIAGTAAQFATERLISSGGDAEAALRAAAMTPLYLALGKAGGTIGKALVRRAGWPGALAGAVAGGVEGLGFAAMDIDMVKDGARLLYQRHKIIEDTELPPEMKAARLAEVEAQLEPIRDRILGSMLGIGFLKGMDFRRQAPQWVQEKRLETLFDKWRAEDKASFEKKVQALQKRKAPDAEHAEFAKKAMEGLEADIHEMKQPKPTGEGQIIQPMEFRERTNEMRAPAEILELSGFTPSEKNPSTFKRIGFPDIEVGFNRREVQETADMALMAAIDGRQLLRHAGVSETMTPGVFYSKTHGGPIALDRGGNVVAGEKGQLAERPPLGQGPNGGKATTMLMGQERDGLEMWRQGLMQSRRTDPGTIALWESIERWMLQAPLADQNIVREVGREMANINNFQALIGDPATMVRAMARKITAGQPMAVQPEATWGEPPATGIITEGQPRPTAEQAKPPTAVGAPAESFAEGMEKPLEQAAKRLMREVPRGTEPPPAEPPKAAGPAPPAPPAPEPAGQPSLGRRLSRSVSYLPSRLAPWLGKHGGEPGKKLEAGITEAAKRQLSAVNVDMQAAEGALKGVKRDVSEKAMRFMNERMTAEEAGPEAVAVADKIRTVLDRALKAAQEIGVERKVEGKWVPVQGSGRAFPEVLNETGRKAVLDAMGSRASKARAKIIEHMLKTGQADTVADAHAKLEAQYGNQTRGVLSHYLSKTRIQLPEGMIEWNPKKVMKAHLNAVWNYVEGARQFGTRWEKLDTLVNQLRDVVPPTYAEGTKTALEAMYGVHPAEPWGATVARTFTNYQRVRTLGASIAGWLRNTNQWIPGNALLTYGDLAKTWAKLPPFARVWKRAAQDLARLVERRAGVSGVTEFTEGDTRNPVIKAAMKVYSAADPSNQIRTAVATWARMESGLKALIAAEQRGKGESRMLTFVRSLLSPLVDPTTDLGVLRGDPVALRRIFGKMGLKPEAVEAAMKSGQWSEKDYQNAAFRMATDTQFMLSNASRRVWHHNDWLKALFLYKGFGIDQLRLLRDHVVDEAAHGNFSPVKRWVLGTLVVGEVYNLLRDWLRDDEKSLTRYFAGDEQKTLRGAASRVMNDGLAGGFIGMIADMTMGVGDWLVGPAGSTLMNVKAAGEAAIEGVARGGSSPGELGQEAMKVLGDLIEREMTGPRQVTSLVAKAASASGVPGLEEALGRDPRLVQSNLWRKRAQDVAGVEENPGVGGMVKDMLKRAWSGKDTWRIEHNTMLYRFAVENIDKGEVEDAASWVRYAVRAAKADPEKLKTLVQSLKAGIEADAPLGPKKHWPAIFAKWPEEEVAEGLALNAAWLSDARTAIALAMDALEEK